MIPTAAQFWQIWGATWPMCSGNDCDRPAIWWAYPDVNRGHRFPLCWVHHDNYAGCFIEPDEVEP